MKVKVKVTGLKEIEKALKDFSKSQTRSILRRSLKAAAMPMVEAAKSNAPDDPDTSTNLPDSITIGTKLAPKAKKEHNKVKDKGAVEMHIGPSGDSAKYAHFTEFGTAKQPPQRWLTRALDSEASDTVRRFADLMWKNIEKAHKSNAKKAAKAAKNNE